MPSSPRDQLGYLQDVLHHARAVLRYLERHATEESFLADFDAQDGASMRMIQVGNAVHSLSAATLAKVPLPATVAWEWAWCYRTRGILAHNYEGIDMGRFWREAGERLPIIVGVVEDRLREVSFVIYRSSDDSRRRQIVGPVVRSV